MQLHDGLEIVAFGWVVGVMLLRVLAFKFDLVALNRVAVSIWLHVVAYQLGFSCISCIPAWFQVHLIAKKCSFNRMLDDVNFSSQNKKVNAVDFKKYLCLQGSSPDLLIRTAGEQRLSNFMLWQHAYTELYFTDCLWPDFNEKELDVAIEYYQKRTRKFGSLKPSDHIVKKDVK